MWLNFQLAERGSWELWGVGVGRGERSRERKMGREKENSFIILCPNKSCFVTVLQIMLPLFAKSLQTVCETEL